MQVLKLVYISKANKGNELETNNKNKNIRLVQRHKLKKGYQPKAKFVKDKKGMILAGLYASAVECIWN